MMDCEHSNTLESTITREFMGHKFHGETLVCQDCGSELWSDKLYSDFNKWVLGLNIKPRIQFKMSLLAEQCLDELIVQFPGSNKTAFVRAMIAVYMQFLKEGHNANNIFNQIFESEFFKAFEGDENHKAFQTDVKALFFFDIQSWGKSFDMKPNEFSLEAFHLMMALCASEDRELRDFWIKKILPQIETIIKAS